MCIHWWINHNNKQYRVHDYECVTILTRFNVVIISYEIISDNSVVFVQAQIGRGWRILRFLSYFT